MENPDIKKEVENNSDFKVECGMDSETKDDLDLHLLQISLVKKEELEAATEEIKSEKDSSSEDSEFDPDFENTSDSEFEINKSNNDEPEQIPQSSMIYNKNIPVRKNSSVKPKKSQLECTLCPQSFPLVTRLITHTRNEHATMKNPTSDSAPSTDDETSTQCPLCLKSLTSVSGLEGHFLRYHIKNKPFQCSICFESTNEIKKFPTKGILNRHIRTVHDPSRWRYNCDICPQKFTCLFHYKEHKSVHTEKKYICEYCSRSYRKKERMLRHIIAVHKEHCDKLETLKCEFCDEVFCSNKDLEDHVLQTHVADTVQCKICFKKFMEAGELNKHLDIAHRENGIRIVCDVCSKVFKQAMDLVKHLEVEHQRFFRCKKCFRSFSTKEEIDCHSTSGKNTDKGHLQCDICLLFLSTECALTIHKKIHLKQDRTKEMADLRLKSAKLEAQLKCDFCPKTFAQKFLLLDHATKCHPNQKWECEFCEKSFQLKYQLVKHEMLHSTRKPFECQVCQKSFSDLSYLKKHEETHKNDKRYKCSQCEKSFALKPSLRLHIANHHGGEKPFKCHICNMAFALKSYLAVHLPLHTAERPFSCDQCSKTYRSAKQLKWHQQTVHSENPKKRIRKDTTHPALHGPHLKYFDDLVYICCKEECDFETKDDKEVALHNAMHGLPLLILSRELPCPLVKDLDASRLTPGEKIKKRTVQPRFKCKYCSKMITLSANLRKHIVKYHTGTKNGKGVPNPVHHGPHSKYVEDLVFVCDVEECDFETKDEKEVVTHNTKSDVSKVSVRRSPRGSSCDVRSTETMPKIIHKMLARYKCTQCSLIFTFPNGLQKHRKKFHM